MGCSEGVGSRLHDYAFRNRSPSFWGSEKHSRAVDFDHLILGLIAAWDRTSDHRFERKSLRRLNQKTRNTLGCCVKFARAPRRKVNSCQVRRSDMFAENATLLPLVTPQQVVFQIRRRQFVPNRRVLEVVIPLLRALNELMTELLIAITFKRFSEAAQPVLSPDSLS